MHTLAVLGLHWIDIAVLAAYFALILYLGVYLGGKKTETLGDFFVAGGKWGPLVSFIFIFASAIAGNEAVVVSGDSFVKVGEGTFHGGISGVWNWWSFLFATPIYYLFCTYYKRARVYSLAEFLEMRFSKNAAAFYSLIAGTICIMFIGMFVLAIGKILSPVTGLSIQQCVWIISAIVAAYVCSGGMMSALLTDLVQGLMCLFILGLVMLPFLWQEAGGMQALRDLPKEAWDFTSEGMTFWKVMAFNVAAFVGGIAAPWIYNWIAISKDEKSATQCGWGHLWKRIITLVFAIYGIFFSIYIANHAGNFDPEVLKSVLEDPELAWGAVMTKILPVGVGLLGLLIASFFAAAMSSADTYATTSSAMFIDYFYRRIISPGKERSHYLTAARIWVVLSVVVGAISTLFVTNISDYVKISLSLLCFLGVPIYFGVIWKKANTSGMWCSLTLGIASYITVMIVTADPENGISKDAYFVPAVFISSSLAILGMWLGSLFGKDVNALQLKRFFVLVQTPIGQEQRLVEAGIRTPSMIDAGLVEDGPEQINEAVLNQLYELDCKDKYFGEDSNIALRRETTLPWYIPGFIRISLACVFLVVGTWLMTRILFVW